MESLAFAHKVGLPYRPPYLVVRPRVRALLEDIHQRRLIIIAASAGYGKTSAILDFAHAAAPFPVCWYALDSFDSDPWVFLRYLVAAFAHQFPDAVSGTQTLLTSEGSVALATIASSLTQEVARIEQPLILVLDDWHFVDMVSEITTIVSALLERCPQLHLILTARHYPQLHNIMLMTARRQVSGLDEDALRFTASELAEAITAEYAIAVTPDEAEQLAEQSDGWITGVLLALVANKANVNRALATHIGHNRHVQDFLHEQVFALLSHDMQQFLCESSVFEEVIPERIATLFGRSNSHVLIESLVQQHLFLQEIRPGVWRYHPLFRDFLRMHARRSNAGAYRTALIRLADDFTSRRQWTEAFATYVEADDILAAVSIAETYATQLYQSGRIETLKTWFAVLPLDLLSTALVCVKALLYLSNKDEMHEAEAIAVYAKQRANDEDLADVHLLQMRICMVYGKHTEVIEHVEAIMHGAADIQTQTQALRLLANAYNRMGNYDAALQPLHTALELAQQQNDQFEMACLHTVLGVRYERTGQYDLAEEYITRSIHYFESTRNVYHGVMPRNNKGVLYHYMGQYRQAVDTLLAVQKDAHQIGARDYEGIIWASIGDVYADLGCWELAKRAYDYALENNSAVVIVQYIKIAQIEVLIRQQLFAEAATHVSSIDTARPNYTDCAIPRLRAYVALGLGQTAEAQAAAHKAVAAAQEKNLPFELARAYLALSYITRQTGTSDACAIQIQLAHTASLLSSDARLVAEALYLPGFMKYLREMGYANIGIWEEQQHYLRLLSRCVGDEQQRPQLIISTLGRDEILLNGDPVGLNLLKAREILFYLLAHDRIVTAETLCDALWPTADLDKSRNRLKVTMNKLRGVLLGELIVFQPGQGYSLNREAMIIEYDVAHFTTLLDQAGNDLDRFETALTYYHGPYLNDSSSAWCEPLRADLDQRYHRTLHRVAQLYEHEQRYADALHAFQRLLHDDLLDEAAHAGAMRCYIALGNRNAAVTQYQHLRQVLIDELGMALEDDSEPEQLYLDMLARS